MPEPLKNMFNAALIKRMSEQLTSARQDFDSKGFSQFILNDTWEQRELKDRMHHVAVAFHHYLGGDYKATISTLKLIIPHFDMEFASMTFPDYVETYGLDDYNTSIEALEFFTQYGSSEFAIRTFILQDEKQTMEHMLRWATHKNHHVRRLASEGCRPRLPWAMALPKYKKDPTPILPILELLKSDEELYVKKSVANNLNDLAKDNPDIVLTTAKKWQGHSKHSNWIIKHGCRTLLKQSNREALSIFGFHPVKISNAELNIENLNISIGEKLNFSFSADVTKPNTRKLRLEYGIDYVKKSGKTSRKIFQISEKDIMPDKIEFKRHQSFQNFSTRTHHAGTHTLTIIVNGAEVASNDFEVK